jgi:hypothetical protein
LTSMATCTCITPAVYGDGSLAFDGKADDNVEGSMPLMAHRMVWTTARLTWIASTKASSLDSDDTVVGTDDGSLDFEGTAVGNVEGSLDFNGTLDGMDDGALDSDGIDEGKLDDSLDSDDTADGTDDGSLDFDGTVRMAELQLVTNQIKCTNSR